MKYVVIFIIFAFASMIYSFRVYTNWIHKSAYNEGVKYGVDTSLRLMSCGYEDKGT